MKKSITIILTIIFSFSFQSCKKDSKSNVKNIENTDSLQQQNFEESSVMTEQTNLEEQEVTYPKTGNKLTDFLPKSGIYEVQYEAEGDLNNDSLADIAVVLKHKKSNTLKRPILILLQNQDKSYRLDKISEVAMPVEYNDNEYKLYDTESIGIEKGELSIDLYSYGPSGTFLSRFKYVENNLVLNYMEAYFRGAGGRSGLFYDFEKGETTTTETNTMREDEPTTSETRKVKTISYPFESTSIIDFFNE